MKVSSAWTKIRANCDWAVLLCSSAIILLGSLSYVRSFSCPLIFDDEATIVNNPTIRHLWPLGAVFQPPSDGSPATGRPAVNFSFALNYSLGGLRVQGYHALNLAIHLMAALTLFGVVRRTLKGLQQRSGVATTTKKPMTQIAFFSAAIWAVHPLQTESVTYVSGRTESLMGLFYLLTLYCFIRGSDPLTAGASDSFLGHRSVAPASIWLSLAVVSAFVGMASKEVMVTAPLMVFLYDRMFLSVTGLAAWRKRRKFYTFLGATWLLLIWLMLGAGTRGGTVGFRTKIPWWQYGAIQIEAVAHYLRLAIWPHPLVIDYGRIVGPPPGVLLLDGLILGTLLFATIVALLRRWPLGFVGAWFFLILLPSSSVVPIATELISEHRMYLPLAALVVLATIGCYTLPGKSAFVMGVIIIVISAFFTDERNRDYRSAESLWQATVTAVPNNAGAHNNLGDAFLMGGKREAAIREFEKSLKLDPLLAGAHNNLGQALGQDGSWKEASAEYEEAIRLAPAYNDARRGLAGSYLRLGRLNDAIAQYENLLRRNSSDGKAHHGLAIALEKGGRMPEAIAEYEQAVQMEPSIPDFHFDLANALLSRREFVKGIEQLEEAIRLQPNYPEARGNLGGALMEIGRLSDAIAQYREALRLKPDLVEAEVDLGSAFFKSGQTADAIACYNNALRLRPDYAIAHYDLGVILQSMGRLDEAAAQFDLAFRLGLRR